MTAAPDAFDRLGLPRRFDLTVDAIEAAWLSRIVETHPDVDSSGDAASAALNDARETLADPRVRADLLLTMFGGPSASEHPELPDGFLSEIMAIRLEVEAAVEHRDDVELGRWRDWARSENQRLTGEIASLFESLELGADRSVREAIRLRLNVWRYVRRIADQLGV